MHGDIAVVAESGGDREAGGERAAGGIDKHVDLFALVVGKRPVNGVAVEVLASDIAFESRALILRTKLHLFIVDK